jgi:hypothetical protein
MFTDILLFTVVSFGVNALSYGWYLSSIKSTKDIGVDTSNLNNLSDACVQTNVNLTDANVQTSVNLNDISIQAPSLQSEPVPSIVLETGTDFINQHRRNPEDADYFNSIADWTDQIGLSPSPLGRE